LDWSRAEPPFSTFWHKEVDCRLQLMLHAAGADVFHRAGMHGDEISDYREPDLGVVAERPPDLANCVSLPAVAFSLVVEILPEDEAGDWYARQGIPAYWIVDQASDRDEVDAHVQILRLKPGQAEYVPERSLLLSELEVEYSANR